MTTPDPTDLARQLGESISLARWASDHLSRLLLPGLRETLTDLPYWLGEAAAELRRLAAWKTEATAVLAEWDQVHEALGSPGQLGESKAAASLAEVRHLAAIETAALEFVYDDGLDDVFPGSIDKKLDALIAALGAQDMLVAIADAMGAANPHPEPDPQRDGET